MFGSVVLEIGIGLALLFLFSSLICSAIREGLESVLKHRAQDLHRGIKELLSDRDSPGLVEHFYKHSLISSLFAGSYDPKKLRNLPSYIPSSSFASAVLDLVARGNDPKECDSAPVTIDSIREAAAKLENNGVKRAVLSALDGAEGDLAQVKVNLEAWFNGSMDRVSGWYKRRTQTILFGLALISAIGLNIDAIRAARQLHGNETMRKAVIERASTIGTNAPGQPATEIAALYPIGWDNWAPPNNPDQLKRLLLWFEMVVGWVVTAFAVMLGAPFWFDVLNKFMVIRATVKPREKSQEEGSEDRPSSGKDRTTSSSPRAHVSAAVSPSEDRNETRAADVAIAAALKGPIEPHAWATGNQQEGDL